MNTTETKTKEKIFADLILDMEESNKHTTEIQEKKTSTRR